MKILLLTVVLCLVLTLCSFAQTAGVNIIPRPVLVTGGSGHFTLSRETKIVAAGDAAKRNAAVLNAMLQQAYGFRLGVTNKKQKSNAVVLHIENLAGHFRSNEEYALEVSPNMVEIRGDEPAGFYAIQTFVQLLPVKIGDTIPVASVRISDYPRFRYRGMHLDIARHFQPVEFVKKFIDQMSQLKLNTFHWHLTDDQGWR